MLTALRILRDVAVYRLRKREMANLAASLTVMLALRLDAVQVGWRLAFGVLLNLSVYLTNDWYDVEMDLASPDKDHHKARRLVQHRGAAFGAQLLLVTGMATIAAVHDAGLWLPLVAGSGLAWAYSARLKGLPVVDVMTIALCGTAGAVLAVPLSSPAGWALAIQLGLFAACFQTIQMVRDHEADAAFGVQTTAVRFGTGWTIRLLRLLLLIAAIYAVCVLHRFVGLALLAAPALPIRADRPDRAWNLTRLWLGLVWLGIVLSVWQTGSTMGLLAELPVR